MGKLSAAFIVGAFRSGTTAMCSILQTAHNAEVFVEQAPKMRIDARKLYENRLEESPNDYIVRTKLQQVKDTNDRGSIYIDKNPNYLLFIPALVEVLDAKILFLHRDGRDVVRSLMDWHDIQEKSIFTLAEDGDHDERKDGKQYPWDYSLLRPQSKDGLQSKWKEMTRFEKCAWYWAKFNQLALDQLGNYFENKDFLSLSMTYATVNQIEKIFDFLSLDGFEKEKINNLMEARINSVKWRSGKENKFPDKEDWDLTLQRGFDKYAGKVMEKLGY